MKIDPSNPLARGMQFHLFKNTVEALSRGEKVPMDNGKFWTKKELLSEIEAWEKVARITKKECPITFRKVRELKKLLIG